VDTEVVDTEVVDTEVVDTEVVDTEVVDTEVVDTEVADTEVADTEVVDTEVADTEVADMEVADMVHISATEAMTFNLIYMPRRHHTVHLFGTAMVHTTLCHINIQRLRGPIRDTVTQERGRRPAFTTSSRTPTHLGNAIRLSHRAV
jgi:hypothetical protein